MKTLSQNDVRMNSRVASEPFIFSKGSEKMRKGKEFYSKRYEEAMKMYNSGIPIKDVASKLDLSYSSVYHWAKGLRKPQVGNLVSFENFIKNSPRAVADVKEKFPKHNELFLTAAKRGIPIKRQVFDKRFGDYATWYFMNGDEKKLKNEVRKLREKYGEVRDKLIKALENF